MQRRKWVGSDSDALCWPRLADTVHVCAQLELMRTVNKSPVLLPAGVGGFVALTAQCSTHNH